MQERVRLERQLDRIKRERFKWADMVMQGAVPPDIAADKQRQLGEQLLTAEANRARLSKSTADHTAVLQAVFELLPACGRAYELSDAQGRRDYNQAWFDGLYLDVDEEATARVGHVDHRPLLTAARAAAGAAEPRLAEAVGEEQRRRRSSGCGGVECAVGSNYELVVDHAAYVAVRDHRGAAAAKRAALAATPLDDRFQTVSVTRRSWWRLTTTVAGDDAPVDDYLTFYRSGIQPVRDAAVLDVDEAALRARMQDYFDRTLTLEQLVARHPGFGITRARYDAARTRRRLLEQSSYRPERVVRVLYRPFDVRWLYWEPDAKLLNEARRELIPFWANVPHQRCLVLPQTPRRAGAVRPVVSRAPAYFAAAEPDARLFPLHRPPSLLLGEQAGELALDVPTSPGDADAGGTLVSAPWCAAARSALGLTDDAAAGEAVFYALVAVMHSPTWLARQPTELDDFPEVPLPGEPAALTAAVDLGRRIADLTDPTVPVTGVTTGRLEPSVAGVAVPDTVAGPVALTYGSYGQRGGQRSGQDVLWAEGHGWRNVPHDVWTYSACGFPVLPKWLSYRLDPPAGNPLHATGHGLRPTDRQEFMLLARRIAALLGLQSACDAAYTAAIATPLEQ